MTITINGTTGIAGVEGSAAIPAVQGVDTNTGIFYDSETVGIATGGSERVRVASSGQIGIAGANYGTSGQVLTSGGAAAAPSWTTITSTGRLLRAPQILTSGTSYTTPAGCTAIYVEAVGGGAGGQGSTNSQGGGGGGAYCAKYFTPVTALTAYTYAIGAGGSTAPSAGGSTTFTVGATTITAGGGAIGTDDGGVGGTATNGDLNARGGRGGWGKQIATSPVVNIYGAGGNSYFGGGGGTGAGTASNSAISYGGGGGGGPSTGGTGFQGIIRIWEYS